MTKLSEPELTRATVISLCVRHSVPVHNVTELHEYFRYKIQPGSFLYAVLCNDLKAACLCADETNRHHIYDIVNLLCREAPTIAWGSASKVDEWLQLEPT